VPESDPEGLPAEVARLRATYRAELGKLVAARDAKARPMVGKYVAALKAFEVELTRARDFEGALRVKAVREEVTARGVGYVDHTPSNPDRQTPREERVEKGNS